MPGLSQLKQFNSDILSLGDEITVRASRGESPVKVPIPKEVKDVNDSEEFVLGMPEIEAPEDLSNVEEDLSDLVGLGTPSSKSDSQSEAAPAFEAPDMSSLLNPIAVSNDMGMGDSMPDLSMFMEEEAAPEEYVEDEPEEVSVADLGLDALLAGSGFDVPEEEEVEEEEETPVANIEDFEEVTDLDSFDIPEPAPAEEPAEETPAYDEPETVDEMEPVEDFASPADDFDFDTSVLDTPADTGTESAEAPASDDPFSSMDTSLFSDTPAAEETFDVPDLGDADLGNLTDLGDTAETLEDFEEVTDAEDLSAPADDFTEAPADDFGTGLDDFAAPADDLGAGLDDFAAPADDLGAAADDFASSADDFAAPADDAFDVPADDTVTESSDNEDFASGVPEGLFDSADMELPSEGGADNGLGGLGDLGDLGNLDDMDFGSGDGGDSVGDVFADSGDSPAEESSDDFGSDNADFDATDFSGDSVDFGSEGNSESEDGEVNEEEFGSVPMEDFDTSEMEGLDFGIPDTDSQISGEGSDFELGGSDDFGSEEDFEIPGFSDVDLAKEEKSAPVITKGKTKEKGKGKKSKKEDVDEADFSGALEGEDLPPNTLSDAQYKVFLKNFNEYPLNVRLAFEDFIVQDEFTDDAEFEIIEKILNKAPARQVAGLLEKMLDISIPVPRDYEHRTAEEYEAYKKSLSYQLKNKIIPGLLVGMVCLLVCWGLFTFGKNCIYKPLRANHFYKQGYTLLEQDEYPQAEINFNRAIEYRYNKSWFFKYARGYREHKQYQRAEKMYENILICYKHDKNAGLEYADMELYDLANYTKAEEVIKRNILDYHINDADGILKLGDTYLEWGTEKDPSKLELAREQYATLIQLYKANDLYESRMMRYFIRTDNLRQVLSLQKRFEPKEKSLSSEDWTELSGYLLDKSYGPIAPAEEYLRYQIEGLRGLLLRAVKTDKTNPIALYNLGRYYVVSGESSSIEPTLTKTIETFNNAKSLRKRDIYKYIDSYRLLGEHYISTNDFLKAQEQLAEGITLYTTERDNAGFEGTPKIGKLYEDLANLKYFVSGEYDEALTNYKSSIELENDSSAIRYKIGYIQYKKSNYAEALGSFMKAGDGTIKDKNLMQAMANTLSLRGDDYAAQGYYEQLLQKLDDEIAEKGVVFPQSNVTEYDLVNTYLSTSNNYGVTLYKLAKRTGNSNLNAQAIVQFSQSVRAWDALTRNQQTMVRLEGSNLAEQNIKYITNRVPDFEPAIYLDIKKTITDKEKF